MDKKNNAYYLGIDLCDTYAMVSFYQLNMEELIRHTIVKKLIFDDHIHFYLLNVNYETSTFQLDL